MFTFKEFDQVYDKYITELAPSVGAATNPNIAKAQTLQQQIQILDQKRARLLIQYNQVQQLVNQAAQQANQQASQQANQVQQATATQTQIAQSAAPATGSVANTAPQ